jgi:hypothetical protein
MHPEQGIPVDHVPSPARPMLAGGTSRGCLIVWWCWRVGLEVGGRRR